jgi:membrane protease YdiL (CAAX protease family)
MSGLIWAAWHVPLILLAAYAPGGGLPVLAALIFAVIATAYAFLLGQLRLSSGSIWPPMLAHSAWNSLTQQAFDPAVKFALWPWLGESGLLQAAVTILVVIVAMRFLPVGKQFFFEKKNQKTFIHLTFD